VDAGVVGAGAPETCAALGAVVVVVVVVVGGGGVAVCARPNGAKVARVRLATSPIR